MSSSSPPPQKRQRTASAGAAEDAPEQPAPATAEAAPTAAAPASEVVESEEEDIDDDGLGASIVLRDAADMAVDAAQNAEQNDATGADGEVAAGEEGEDAGANSGDAGTGETEAGAGASGGAGAVAESKFKFSGKAGKKKMAALPGRAGLVTPDNYVAFAAELGKRNTPFEIDLDSVVDKPWARYNASLDDFFNFGFNEQKWREFAARQVALRIHAMELAKEGATFQPDAPES